MKHIHKCIKDFDMNQQDLIQVVEPVTLFRKLYSHVITHHHEQDETNKGCPVSNATIIFLIHNLFY
jgi:hypothetical protein